MPMTATTATAMIMAISVVINGASVGSVGSGSIGPEGVTAGPTPMAVSAYELKYESEPSNVAMTVYLPSFSGFHM